MYDMSERRKVLLGITGSIAAYKSAELARVLVSWGHEVRCVMTRSAVEFITPLTMQSITNHPVITDFWNEREAGIGHIEASDWADVLVIAPASADCIAKLAAGFADSPLLAIALATRAPILVAPAMNMHMYEHPKTQENIRELRGRGIHFVDPEEGALACGWNGTGRLAEPQEIFYHTRRLISRQDLAGKRVLIATGPTREPIDPVRFLSNRSSGKMGVALAREAFRRGAQVTLVHGPARIKVPGPVRCIEVETAQQMYEAMLAEAAPQGDPAPDVIIMAAAVADFRPEQVSPRKIKKGEQVPTLSLAKTPDILAELGKRRGEERRPVLVGFAVETGEIEDLLVEARAKLERKSVDLIVGNFAAEAFDLDTNHVWLVDRNGKEAEIATTYKSRVSNQILDAVLKL